MVAGSILPISIHKGKIYFLFGKENPLEDSSKGWSDFGGGCENKEKPYDTALREGSEELTGFLGNREKIDKRIKKAGGFFKIEHNDYHSHLFLMNYDENLPNYYNDNHELLWRKMNNKLLNKTKLFEKIEIEWFSLEDMRRRISEFRNFYQEIIKKIIEEYPKIMKFVRSKNRKTQKKVTSKSKSSWRKSRRMRGGK